jgi:hypothetical protein
MIGLAGEKAYSDSIQKQTDSVKVFGPPAGNSEMLPVEMIERGDGGGGERDLLARADANGMGGRALQPFQNFPRSLLLGVLL